MGELQFAKTFLTSVDSKSTKYQPDHVFDPKNFPTRIPYTLPKLSSPPHPPPPTAGPAPAPPPGSETAPQSISLTLKSSRNPAMTLTLTELVSSTLISDLKSQVHTHLGGSSVVDISKIKILSNKKPIPPSKKTLGEVLSDSADAGKTDVEFGVMVMGGAPDPPPSAPTTLFAASQAQASGPGSEDAAREAESKAHAPAVTGSIDQSTSTLMEGIEKTKSPPVVQPGEAIIKVVLATDGFWIDLEGFLQQRLKDSDQASKLMKTFRTAYESSQAAP